MNQHFETLDETVKAIKADCDLQLQTMRDKLLAAEVEATMAKDQLKLAREAQASAERVTTKLLTQFGLVAKVFEEARELALKLEPPPIPEQSKVLIDAAVERLNAQSNATTAINEALHG